MGLWCGGAASFDVSRIKQLSTLLCLMDDGINNLTCLNYSIHQIFGLHLSQIFILKQPSIRVSTRSPLINNVFSFVYFLNEKQLLIQCSCRVHNMKTLKKQFDILYKMRTLNLIRIFIKKYHKLSFLINKEFILKVGITKLYCSQNVVDVYFLNVRVSTKKRRKYFSTSSKFSCNY